MTPDSKNAKNDQQWVGRGLAPAVGVDTNRTLRREQAPARPQVKSLPYICTTL